MGTGPQQARGAGADGANTVNLASPMTPVHDDARSTRSLGAFTAGRATPTVEPVTVGADGRAVLRAADPLGSKSIVFFNANPLARHAFVFTGALAAISSRWGPARTRPTRRRSAR